MHTKSIFRIVLVAAALVICAPVVWFVFVHLKEGYDAAEREKAALPPVPAAPVIPAAPAVPQNGSNARALASLDFSKLDFSGNSTAPNNRTDHFAAALPPLNGTGRNGYREGLIGQGRFEMRGGVESLSGASWVRLPSAPHAGGMVVLEVAVDRGAVRVYLQGLNGSFVDGYVFADASPGHPARVTGFLQDQSDSGTPDQNFALETRGGDAQGISYRVYRKE